MKDDILATLDGLPVAAVFIYGSVARGTATAGSDIDLFVLLDAKQPPDRMAALRTRFADLQRQLGYQPDIDYPVELFTVDQVRAALTTDAPDEDQREVRHALGDTKIVLAGSARLEELIAMAGGRP